MAQTRERPEAGTSERLKIASEVDGTPEFRVRFTTTGTVARRDRELAECRRYWRCTS